MSIKLNKKIITICTNSDECRALAKEELLHVQKTITVPRLNPGESYTSVVSPVLVKSEDNQIAVAQKV